MEEKRIWHYLIFSDIATIQCGIKMTEVQSSTTIRDMVTCERCKCSCANYDGDDASLCETCNEARTHTQDCMTCAIFGIDDTVKEEITPIVICTTCGEATEYVLHHDGYVCKNTECINLQKIVYNSIGKIIQTL